MSTAATVTRWTNTARRLLQGKKIVEVRYMTTTEAESMGFYRRAVVMVLDDGSWFFPAADDEGNDAGALFTSSEDDPVLPVI